MQFFYLLCSQFRQKASSWINKTLLLVKQQKWLSEFCAYHIPIPGDCLPFHLFIFTLFVPYDIPIPVTTYLFISVFLGQKKICVFKIKRWKGRQSPGIGIWYGERHVKIKRWKGRQSPGVGISYGEHHVKIKRWKGLIFTLFFPYDIPISGDYLPFHLFICTIFFPYDIPTPGDCLPFHLFIFTWFSP
jgi:hypothetical protein